MKNKWVRFIVTILLVAVIEVCGNDIGGSIGDIIVIFAGVVFIYAIVGVFKKQKTI